MLMIINDGMRRRWPWLSLYWLLPLSIVCGAVADCFILRPMFEWLWISSIFEIMRHDRLVELEIKGNPKFKTYDIESKHFSRFALLYVLMNNPFFWFSASCALFALGHLAIWQFVVSGNLLAWLGLYSMLTCKRWLKNSCIGGLVVIQVMQMCHLSGIFLVCLGVLLIGITLDKLWQPMNQLLKRVDGYHFPLVIRYVFLADIQIKAYLVILGCLLPWLVSLLLQGAIYQYSLSFIPGFVALVIFEIISDGRIEAGQVNLASYRWASLSGIRFFQRFLRSRYLNLWLVTVFIMCIGHLQVGIFQSLQLLLAGLWYQFFDERALYGKVTFSSKLGWLRGFVPITLTTSEALLPWLTWLLERKG